MLEFFEFDDFTGYASFYDNHITFNKSLLKCFENAYRVRVAVDKNLNKVFIFPINKDYALSGELKESSLLRISFAKTYVRICSRPLMEYICNSFGLEIPKKHYKRFKAEYDESKKVITIDMEGGSN